MIPPGELFRLAHRLGLGDKTIEQDHVLTWMLLAIANSHLRDRVAFKGGTFERLWEPRLRGQMPNLPHLDAVIRETNRWLRQSGLA